MSAAGQHVHLTLLFHFCRHQACTQAIRVLIYTQHEITTTASEIRIEILGSLVTWTKVVYALHAFSLLTGIIGTATVVGAFLTGWPSIIAVILNYIKRSEARDTWLESHFR